MGTLMDDLVTKDLREPYRMLTSRCVFKSLLGVWVLCELGQLLLLL